MPLALDPSFGLAFARRFGAPTGSFEGHEATMRLCEFTLGVGALARASVAV